MLPIGKVSCNSIIYISISFFKKAGGRLALSLYVFLLNASAGPRGPVGTCPPPSRIIYTVMVSMDRTRVMLNEFASRYRYM